MYRTESRLRIFSNRVVSALLSLSLFVSPVRIPCKLKLSIEPAFLSFYSVSILASTHYFLQTSRPLGLAGNWTSGVAFRLRLPVHMCLHPVFHVSLLEPYTHFDIYF